MCYMSLFCSGMCTLGCYEYLEAEKLTSLTDSDLFCLLVSAKTTTRCTVQAEERPCQSACIDTACAPAQFPVWRTHNVRRLRACARARSVGKKQWCIPAHISPAGDNCAISQRVAETLFTACCGGAGGGYELMSSERKTTSSHTRTDTTRTQPNMNAQ